MDAAKAIQKTLEFHINKKRKRRIRKCKVCGGHVSATLYCDECGTEYDN